MLIAPKIMHEIVNDDNCFDLFNYFKYRAGFFMIRVCLALSWAGLVWIAALGSGLSETASTKLCFAMSKNISLFNMITCEESEHSGEARHNE
nr:hypothetical protein [Tanacetum cinerariifolium]